MLISFIISEYEYKINKVINTNQFEQAYTNFTAGTTRMSSRFNATNLMNDPKQLVELVNAGKMAGIDAWKTSILSTQEYGEPFLRFTLTAIIAIGAFLKLIYQSYGMAGLPIFLIKGTKSLETENSEIQTTIQTVREQLRQI
jgi:hypothetical protein